MAAPHHGLPPDALARLDRLRSLARLLDARFGIPGTRFSIGADSILGLIPGIGDAATALASLYILSEARKLGVGTPTLVRMGWNVAVDLGVGAVPVLGDLFDFFWKSNLRNMDLLEAALARRGSRTPGTRP